MLKNVEYKQTIYSQNKKIKMLKKKDYLNGRN